MIRFLMRSLGAVLLAVALVYGVADIARSLADDAVMLTPLSEALAGLGLPSTVPDGTSPATAGLLARVLAWPMSVLAGVLALLLLAAGRPGRRGRRLTP
ncbi:hypothetical protein [Aureimonas glaciei]|uniref:Uncharacterized protein n=1 Tax=Aureimonas glaciei TaxID=1776957 RepID=A0A916XT07_9HYPH|nr:hypothetical protein [Aureimonas glaciei]GGD05228.1 hypothetical protein GCM10011335_05160 [Aureimonas glaciei]